MRKVIVLRPVKDDSNPYMRIVRCSLEDLGYEIISLKDIIKPEYITVKIEVALFNWYENVHLRNGVGKFFVICKKKLCFFYLKHVRKSKVVITLHNKYSHDTEDVMMAKKLLAWQIHYADKIVVMNSESVRYLSELMSEFGYEFHAEKAFKLFHPSYDKVVGDYLKQKTGFSVMRLVFFGRLVQYKNIEILIDLADMLANTNIHIDIFGNGEKEYTDDLTRMISDRPNISIHVGFVEDKKLYEIIHSSDCVLLPYDKASVLNSGAVLLAMTLGKNVICPRIGTVADMPDDLLYSYDYANEEDHIQHLYETTLKAYNEFWNQPDTFMHRQKKIEQIIASDYSYENFKAGMGELLKNLEC